MPTNTIGNHPPPPPYPAVESVAGNEDLLVEILSRLSTKPVIRFKSVSRHWFHLISGRRFSLIHSRRNPKPPCSALFLHSSPPFATAASSSSSSSSPFSSEFQFIPLSLSSFHSPPPSLSRINFSSSTTTSILQSCNGLLLVCDRGSRNDGSDCSYYVCNPTTDAVSEVVCPDFVGECVVGVNLAFDPSRWDQYRVICVRNSEIEERFHVIDVYKPSTGAWRRVTDGFIPSFDMEFERGVYWNGSVHWLSHTETTLYFDVEKDCLRSLALPPTLVGGYMGRFRYFGESRGHLHLIEIRRNCYPRFDVMELDGDDMCWFPKYRVDLDVVGCEFTEMFQDSKDRFGRHLRFYAFSILSVVRGEGEGEDDSALIVSIPGKVLSYSFATETTKMLCEVVDQSDRWIPFKGYNAYQYIASLCTI
ncbi:hypothetical protein Drorol1_Dr00002077 [Drosera rotundifolia]